MAELSVIIADLKAKADELDGLNQQFMTQVGALEETEGSLNGMWEGDAKEQFHAAFTNDITQMHNFYNAVMQYVNVLIEAVNRYQQAECQNIEIAQARHY